MSHLYKVHFHKSERARKADCYLFRTDWQMNLEDVLTSFKIDFPERYPIAVQEDGKFIWTLKDDLGCPYCGGIDAHSYNCKGGFGL